MSNTCQLLKSNFYLLVFLIRLSKVSLYFRLQGKFLVLFSCFSAISSHISLIGGIFISFFILFKYHP